MSIGERLRYFMDMRGIRSANKLASLSGVSQTTISAILRNDTDPSLNTIRQLCEALSITEDVFFDGSSVRSEYDDDIGFYTRRKTKSGKEYRRIPVLGSVPAGVPIDAVEDIVDYEDIDESYFRSGHDFVGLTVHGNSMEPEYKDGDVLIIRLQDTADSGDDAVVFVNGDDSTFKRISLNSDGIILRPLNPAYEPLYFSNEEIEELPVRVFGIAVEFRRTIRR